MYTRQSMFHDPSTKSEQSLNQCMSIGRTQKSLSRRRSSTKKTEFSDLNPYSRSESTSRNSSCQYQSLNTCSRTFLNPGWLSSMCLLISSNTFIRSRKSLLQSLE